MARNISIDHLHIVKWQEVTLVTCSNNEDFFLKQNLVIGSLTSQHLAHSRHFLPQAGGVYLTYDGHVLRSASSWVKACHAK